MRSLALLLTLTALSLAASSHAGNVLILETTVIGGSSSAAGHTPVMVSETTWAGLTTADFKSYTAIVLGSPGCTGIHAISAAQANAAVWGAAITGYVLIDTLDDTSLAKDELRRGGIKFATDEPGTTGLYASLSCYYVGMPDWTPVEFLSGVGVGRFMAGSGGCRSNVVKTIEHPALMGVTSTSLLFPECSVRNAFVDIPGDFLPLATSTDVTTWPGWMPFPDTSSGIPYIVVAARGKLSVTVAPCGNGNLDAGEECDDGNTANGDGCSAQCKIEPKTTVNVRCPAVHRVVADTDYCGVKRLDLRSLVSTEVGATLSLVPNATTFPVGTTTVTVTATLGSATGNCTFAVTVTDETKPTIANFAQEPKALWPPNHKMSLVTFTYDVVDNCAANKTQCAFKNATSSEPDNTRGDGNTMGDIQLVDGTRVLARAERRGPGRGRTYNLTLECPDEAGNSVSLPVSIVVPHGRRTDGN